MDWTRSLVAAALAPLVVAATSPARVPFTIDGDRSATINWSQQFASANDDWVNDIVALGTGKFMAVGFLNRGEGHSADWHALAAEFSIDGRVIARQIYGEGEGIDAFWSMAEERDGRRMFAGFTTRIGGGGIDGFAALTDASGLVRSERAFGSSGYDRFTDLALVRDGYALLGHSQAEGTDKRRIFIVKTDLEGRPLWERIHDAPDSWGALYLEPTRDGGFIIAGGTTVDGDSDMFAMKVDSEGRELWRKRIGTPDWDEVNHGLVLRPDGTIVLTGYTHKRGEEANDLVAATLTPSGDVQRIERFGSSSDDRAILAKADAMGHIWIVGHSAGAGAGGSDLLLTRLDRQGKFEHAAVTIGGPQDDNGTALLPLADGSLLLAGYSRGLGAGGQDAFVLQLTRPAWDKPNPAFRREVVKP